VLHNPAVAAGVALILFAAAIAALMMVRRVLRSLFGSGQKAEPAA
jgi:hypothetical protein